MEREYWPLVENRIGGNAPSKVVVAKQENLRNFTRNIIVEIEARSVMIPVKYLKINRWEERKR